MSQPLSPRFLNIDEVSKLLRVPRSWLYDRTRRKIIPHYRLGKYIRFKLDEIETWMEKNREGMGWAHSPTKKGVKSEPRA